MMLYDLLPRARFRSQYANRQNIDASVSESVESLYETADIRSVPLEELR